MRNRRIKLITGALILFSVAGCFLFKGIGTRSPRCSLKVPFRHLKKPTLKIPGEGTNPFCWIVLLSFLAYLRNRYNSAFARAQSRVWRLHDGPCELLF